MHSEAGDNMLAVGHEVVASTLPYDGVVLRLPLDGSRGRCEGGARSGPCDCE